MVGVRIAVLIPDPYFDRVLVPQVRDQLMELGDIVRPASTSEGIGLVLPEILPQVEVCLTGWGTPTLPIVTLPTDSRLRVIAHTAGSVRHLIPRETFGRGIQVTHAAAIIADAVAEFTLLQVLEGLRRAGEMNRRMKAGFSFNEASDVYDGFLLNGRHVGIVGAGYVGRRLVRLLKPFGVTISIFDPYLSEADATEMGVSRSDLDTLFAMCDIVSLHAPRTAETHHMIQAYHLGLLPPGAILVNTASSWLIDAEVLLRELRLGRIWAALDVFDEEPLPTDSPLRHIGNVVLTPHVAGRSLTTLRRQGQCMVEEIRRWCHGDPLEFGISEYAFSILA